MRNPQAADNLEGIVRWRLLGDVVHRKMVETRQALDWLIEEGLLLETSLPGIEPTFSLNPDMRDKAEQLLKESDDPSPEGDGKCR